MRPAACARFVCQAGDITCPIAYQWHRLLAEVGKNKHAFVFVRKRLATDGIHNLGVKMVFPDVATSTYFYTFLSDTWPEYFGETVQVGASHTEILIDLC